MHKRSHIFRVVNGTAFTGIWDEVGQLLTQQAAAAVSSDCKQERILSGMFVKIVSHTVC